MELASGSTTLYKVSEHRTLLSKEPVEVIVPLHRLVGLGYRLNWSSAAVSITHPEYGKIECTLRGGCPVLPEGEALNLLEVMEKADRGELMMDSEIRAWWASKFPEVPQETWEYMRGQMAYDPCLCPRLLPCNWAPRMQPGHCILCTGGNIRSGGYYDGDCWHRAIIKLAIAIHNDGCSCHGVRILEKS